MTTTKLRVQIGDVEVECEGDADFIKDERPNLFDSVIHKVSALAFNHSTLEPAAPAVIPTGGQPTGPAPSQGPIESSVSNIAIQLGAKTGPELFKAALAYLQLVEEKSRATRSEVLKTMQEASHTYKPAMAGNLTPIIKSLMSAGVVNEPKSGEYCLKPNVLKDLRSQLT